MSKKSQIKIGQKVFIIGRDLNIVEKKVLAIVEEEKETKYKLDLNSCGGISENDFFLTKGEVEVKIQNFRDDLKFNVGDLVIFKHKEYHTYVTKLGRIKEIKYDGCPYKIKTTYENIYDLTDEDITLKIDNSYIENYGRLKELNMSFKVVEKELNDILSLIHKEHDMLEKELKKSFKKEFAWYRIKKTPLFKDRFSYKEEDY